VPVWKFVLIYYAVGAPLFSIYLWRSWGDDDSEAWYVWVGVGLLGYITGPATTPLGTFALLADVTERIGNVTGLSAYLVRHREARIVRHNEAIRPDDSEAELIDQWLRHAEQQRRTEER
jgi:hypothetical protein